MVEPNNLKKIIRLFDDIKAHMFQFLCTTLLVMNCFTVGAVCIIFPANWIVDGTDSSERLILNVCRRVSRVDADTGCPRGAAVCLVSEYYHSSVMFL